MAKRFWAKSLKNPPIRLRQKNPTEKTYQWDFFGKCRMGKRALGISAFDTNYFAPNTLAIYCKKHMLSLPDKIANLIMHTRLGILLAFVMVFLSGQDGGRFTTKHASEKTAFVSFHREEGLSHEGCKRDVCYTKNKPGSEILQSPVRRRFTPVLSVLESPTPNGQRIASAIQMERLFSGTGTLLENSLRPSATFYPKKNIHPQTGRLRYNPARRRFTPVLPFLESPPQNGQRIASAAQTRRLRYVKDRAQPQLYASLVNSLGYVVGAKLAASGLYAFEGDTTWRHIGWNHPRVYAIAVVPSDAEVIFLGCGNGVLRTLDGGRSWRLTTDWRVTEALDIAIASAAPVRVYVATAYGVWRSQNRGKTWLQSNRGLKRTFTQAVEVDRRNPKRLFAGTESGLYVSEDGAQSWTLAGLADVTVLDIQQGAASPEIWLLGTQTDGVWLSNDDGRTWQKAEGGITQASIYSVAIDPTDRRNLAAAGWDTGVFISDDGGQSWRQQKNGLPTHNFYAVAFHPVNCGQIWAATVEAGVFKSGDLGRTWTYQGLRGALVFDLTFSKAN